ncbi:unnamed protein product [Auanema sp. JU1783]|nr:unnamed protein product [Auanema sp. JU1783]
MMFTGGTPSSRATRHKILTSSKIIKLESAIIQQCELPMYNTPPANDISLEEFDGIASQRLKLLKKLENLKELSPPGTDEFVSLAKFEFNKFFSGEDRKRNDIIGHYILRLAFCRTPENMKWLIQQEVDLFRARFQSLNNIQVVDFMKENDISLESVLKDEKEDLCEELAAACAMSAEYVLSTDFFKLNFVEALELVRRRKVYLNKGYAYVCANDLSVIMCSMLKGEMGAAMLAAAKHLALIEEEGRILPRLSRLANNAYDGKQYDAKEASEKISRHDIDALCAASFPPCMKHCHAGLRANHHLRHGGRRQYGVFLKGIGLSMEEALLFMREEFTKKIDSEKFDKEYSYYIRHMYGKEGKRVEYNSFSCSTIILNNAPTAQDCSGCPFKHLDHNILKGKLERDLTNKSQVERILNLSKEFAFDKACTRYFEYFHKMDEGALGQLITHPNQYYELSREVLAGTRAKDNHIIVAQPVQDDMDWN